MIPAELLGDVSQNREADFSQFVTNIDDHAESDEMEVSQSLFDDSADGNEGDNSNIAEKAATSTAIAISVSFLLLFFSCIHFCVHFIHVFLNDHDDCLRFPFYAGRWLMVTWYKSPYLIG